MVHEKIEALKNKIVEAAQPEKIILFGSYARGAQTEYSDVDLLVIAPSSCLDGNARNA